MRLDLGTRNVYFKLAGKSAVATGLRREADQPLRTPFYAVSPFLKNLYFIGHMGADRTCQIGDGECQFS